MDWRNIPSLSALRAFETTARLGGFSKAAKELNVTHAAIAQHVRALELEFSEKLVFRQGRGVALTKRGEQLARSLRSGFSEIAQAVQDLQSHKENRPLNISITPGFGINWLMPNIGDFWQSHPEIELNINPTHLLVDLAADGYDMAIRHGDGNWSDVKSERLLRGDFCVVCKPSLLGSRKADCLADVADLPWLIDTYTMERKKMLEAEGLDLAKADVRSFTSNQLLASALNAGVGIGVMSHALVARKIEDGDLIKICDLSHEGVAYYMITREGYLNKNLEKFKGWLLKTAA